jgi:DNA invertase Pin-like site-specific DNA recombinase
MRVAVYARVSTVDLRKKGAQKGQSPEMQLFALRNYAAARNWEIVQEFVDEGISGSKRSRPQLNLLLDGVRKRKFDGVLVWKFDRWARSTHHLLETLGEFRRLGVQFFSYTENFDTSSPMGEAMFAIIGAMAQLERDLNGERTSAGMAYARSQGRKPGRKPSPEKEAAVLKLHAKNHSRRKIARALKVSVAYVQKVVKKAAEPTSSEAA